LARRRIYEVWLRVELRTACFALAFDGNRLLHGSDYGMSIALKRQIKNFQTAYRYFARSGATLHTIDSHGTIRPLKGIP